VVADALPADPEGAKVVMPADCPLDDPSSGLLAANGTSESWFTAPTDVRCDASVACFSLGLRIVVPLVEADVSWTTSPAAGEEGHGVERRTQHVLVVDVGARDRHGQGDPPAVGQEVPFRAEFRAIGRVGPGEVPPFGAFTLALSRDAHSQSIPTLPS